MSQARSPATSHQPPEPPRRHWLRTLLEAEETRKSYIYTCIGLWSLCFYLIITNFVGGTVEIVGESMWPTLIDGRTYVLNRWSYHFRKPRRGELVVIRDPGYSDMAVKRVVGMGGEQVDIRDGAVFLNGSRLDEPYLPPTVATLPINGTNTQFKLRESEFFVLGDNRTNSLDSRAYGALHRQNIVGLVSPWGARTPPVTARSGN